MASSALSATLLGVSPAYAVTGVSEILGNALQSMDTNATLMLAVFGGAMSFALLSAIWMIRERSRIVQENQKLKRGLTELRALSDRNSAIAGMPGQYTIVWNNAQEAPIILGQLPDKSAIPSDHDQLLAFERWLSADSASLFDAMLAELRSDARSFKTALRNKEGELVEVIGNTTAGYAYVKLADLSAERKEHARLQSQHDNLQATFSTLESLLQKLPLPVWMRRDDSSLSWVNPAYAHAVDAQTPQEVVKSDAELFDANLKERLSSQDNDALFMEEVRATIAGDRKPLDVFNVKSKSGSAGIAFDKSDLDQVRKALEETNDGHSKMLDQLATAVAIFDKSQKLVFFNSSFQQMWKLEQAFLDSQPSNSELLDAMRDVKLLPEHPDWRKWRDEQVSIYQALESREEWWHLLDGQTVRVVSAPQNTGGSNWIFENVTERLALESNYNALIRVQGETLDHLNEAVAVFGSDGKLRLFNPALEALSFELGLETQENIHISAIIESWSGAVTNPEQLVEIQGKVTGLDDTRDEIRGRINVTQGQVLEYSVVPLPEGQSMLTFADVTATVKFENALRERAEALEESDLLKSKFINRVSYQLRAPLTSISGFGELLATPELGSLNSKQDEYLGHINSAVSVLRTLVDDILDLASIDAGTMRLDLQKVDVQSTVDSVLLTHVDVMKSKGLKAEVSVEKSAAMLNADPERLEQILDNLISNAVTISPDGGTISIRAKCDADEIELEIADEGPGIAEADRDKVFDRFEAQVTTNGRQGSGLGLSIVKGFVELHGGKISIKENVERGACFVCAFPIGEKSKQTLDDAPDTDAGSDISDPAVAAA
jgi:signal transduction histidine kinase